MKHTKCYESFYPAIILFLIIFINIYYSSITRREALTMRKVKRTMMKPINKVGKGLKAMIDAIKDQIKNIKLTIESIGLMILSILILPFVIWGLSVIFKVAIFPFLALIFTSKIKVPDEFELP